jgi:hypothetical protein
MTFSIRQFCFLLVLDSRSAADQDSAPTRVRTRSEGAHRFYHEGTAEFAEERAQFFELSGLNHEMQRKYLGPDQVRRATVAHSTGLFIPVQSQAESIWRDYLLDFHRTCRVYAAWIPHMHTPRKRSVGFAVRLAA